MSNPVRCNETGEIFETQIAAEKHFGIHHGGLVFHPETKRPDKRRGSYTFTRVSKKEWRQSDNFRTT